MGRHSEFSFFFRESRQSGGRKEGQLHALTSLLLSMALSRSFSSSISCMDRHRQRARKDSMTGPHNFSENICRCHEAAGAISDRIYGTVQGNLDLRQQHVHAESEQHKKNPGKNQLKFSKSSSYSNEIIKQLICRAKRHQIICKRPLPQFSPSSPMYGFTTDKRADKGIILLVARTWEYNFASGTSSAIL